MLKREMKFETTGSGSRGRSKINCKTMRIVFRRVSIYERLPVNGDLTTGFSPGQGWRIAVIKKRKREDKSLEETTVSEISEVISELGLLLDCFHYSVRRSATERDDANWKGCGASRCWRDPLDERLIAEFLDFHLTAVSNASQVISLEFHFAATMRIHGCKIAEFSCSLVDASRYKLIYQTLKFSRS